jgi:hypothetical protein
MVMTFVVVVVPIVTNLSLWTFDFRLMTIMVMMSVARLPWSMRPSHRTSKKKTYGKD